MLTYMNPHLRTRCSEYLAFLNTSSIPSYPPHPRERPDGISPMVV